MTQVCSLSNGSKKRRAKTGPSTALTESTASVCHGTAEADVGTAHEDPSKKNAMMPVRRSAIMAWADGVRELLLQEVRCFHRDPTEEDAEDDLLA